MRLLFLGTGGSIETPARHTTGLYLPEHGILLDAGTNVFPLRQLHRAGPLRVLMSHYHVDHSIGLFFLSAGLFHGGFEPEISVYGPPWEDRFRKLAGPKSPLWPVALPFPIRQAPERFELDGVEVSTRMVPHAAPVLGYRLRFPSGETLAYVTDTTAPDGYLEFVRGVDVLVHECSFSTEDRSWAEATRHSDAESVGKLARDAGVQRLYLTHIGPLADAEALLQQVRVHFPAAEIPVEGVEYGPDDGSVVDARRAVFPGSFDPLTVSHLDIIHTCVEMFTSVHVVVARNPGKDRSALFEPVERAELIRRCVDPSVTVSVWDGLTIDYARKVRAGRLVRGLGRAEDYTVEVRLWKTNAILGPEMQTVWVPPRPEHLDVSSSMIKEAAVFGGWERVKHLVPAPVRKDVGARIAARRSERE